MENRNTCKIIAAELSASNVTDLKVLPNLLKQTRQKINEISTDSSYDTRQYYETVRIKQAVPTSIAKRGIVTINIPYQRQQYLESKNDLEGH
ncbi:Mobile element protein [Candidatus Enterovibrio altilux]|uniref:Mobile element protein n=1 Tax=Candidatus Enterovibrio altilux TaxID=1927128 RepID=A0A291BBY5_9GAMM|nr:Mobile element protein [Candidatus Enterovibrio luxaltus]